MPSKLLCCHICGMPLAIMEGDYLMCPHCDTAVHGSDLCYGCMRLTYYYGIGPTGPRE